MKYLIALLLVVLTFSNCISNRYVKGTLFKNTLLYQNQDSIHFYPGYKVALWKPTKKELQLAESFMQIYINENKKLKDLDTYTRQYIGIIDKSKRVVLIKGFCVSPKLFCCNQNWKKKIISVDDGGDCFFSIKVDLNLKECYDFDTNSEG